MIIRKSFSYFLADQIGEKKWGTGEKFGDWQQ